MKKTSRHQLALIAIWLLALLLNGAFAVMRPGSSPDSERYQRIGLNLARGHGYSSSPQAPYKPEVLRPPGYPVLLALAYRLSADGPLAARLIQAFLMSLLVPLGFTVARDALGEREAWLTALFAAGYPYFWVYSAALLSEAPAVFLMAVIAALLVWSARSTRVWSGLPVGAAIGLLTLVKPIAVLLPVCVAVAYRARRPRVVDWPARTALCLVGCALVVLPWTARNYQAVGRLLPVAAGKGMQLYAAAISTARSYSVQEYFREVLDQDPRVLRAQFDDDPYLTMQLDDQLWQEALSLYASHPGRLAIHLLVTPVRVWLSIYSYGPGGFYRSWPHLLLTAGLLTVGIAGVVVRRRLLGQAVVPLTTIIYFSAVHAPFCPEARQSLPARLFLLMFVASFLVWVWDRVRRVPATDSGAAAVETVPASRGAL